MPLKKILGWFNGSAGSGKTTEPFSVVFSTGGDFADEQKIVKKMLDAGLTRFHLRKPDWSKRDLAEWLEPFTAAQRARIVVHAFPELVKEMKLAGFHMRNGRQRPRGMSRDIETSCSCDSFQEMMNEARTSKYVILGPVFPTYSKKDYEPHRTPEEFAEINAAWRAEDGCPVLALGGVSAKNMAEAKALGFSGFAVISAVWESSDPVKGFKALLKAWK